MIFSLNSLLYAQGRKKKPFIDKKHAQTFSLVPRSHKDPLHDDPEEAQYVLKQIQVQSLVCYRCGLLKSSAVKMHVIRYKSKRLCIL